MNRAFVNSPVGRVGAALDRLTFLLAVVSGLILSTVTVAALVDLVFRNVGSLPLLRGLFDFAEFALVAGVCLVFAEMHRSGLNVASDVLAIRLKPLNALRMEFVGILVALPGFVIATWAVFQRAVESYATRETRVATRELIVWPGRALLAFGFFLFLLQIIHGIVGLGRHIRSGATSEGSGHEPPNGSPLETSRKAFV